MVDNQGIMNLSLLQSVLTGSGTHTAPYLMGMRGFFLEVNGLRHEANHSPVMSSWHAHGQLFFYLPCISHILLCTQEETTSNSLVLLGHIDK
jgi:hypothetical protein